MLMIPDLCFPLQMDWRANKNNYSKTQQTKSGSLKFFNERQLLFLYQIYADDTKVPPSIGKEIWSYNWLFSLTELRLWVTLLR